MKTDFFLDLLHQVKEFESSDTCRPHSTVEDFRRWMNDKKYREESSTKLFKNENHRVSFVENEICKQVILLGRFSKQLIRKGLSAFPDLANEEFTYLYRLKDEPFLTKIQLIEKNGHEKQTGTQIIKRLIDAGLVEEKIDREDKRMKRLNLTEKGEEVFGKSVSDVNLTSKLLSGQMTAEEKAEFLTTLKKLNEFHAHLYSEYKNSDIYNISEIF